MEYPKRSWSIDKDTPWLKPGTIVVGGRNFCYDAQGIIVDAWETGGDPEKDEDWAFLVDMYAYIGSRDPWVLGQCYLRDIWASNTTQELLMDLDSRLVLSSDAVPILKSVNEELMAYIANNPRVLDKLHPNAFEQVIYSIYKNHGFSAKRIGGWNQADGGIDLLAVDRNFPSGKLTIAIQCKISKNKITAKPIRELAGVLEAHKAHMGIVATTSEFTDAALGDAERYHWRINLLDKRKVIEMLKEIYLPKNPDN